MHHFRFTSSSPGAVFVKSDSSGPERKIYLLKNTLWSPSADDPPPLIISTRLSAEWKQYLFDKIRKFCPAEKCDSVCPES